MAEYECAYCGQVRPCTDDHIPPRSIYQKPLPHAVPTVKACAPCNVGASADDEYFRDVLLKHHQVADLPQAREQVERMLRAVTKPQKRRYAQAVFDSFIDIPVRTPAGLHLGMAPAFRVDGPRLQRVLARYIAGLHRYELGRRVPDTTAIVSAVNPDAINAAADSVMEIFGGGTQRFIQQGVFWYAYVQPVDRPEASGWLLVFFDAVPFMASVRPPGGSASH